MKTLTWEEIKARPTGEILHDEFNEGIRFIVMRGPCTLCAYLGIPKDHPLAGFDYDDIPIQCHGGLTFSSEGRDSWPQDFYWYGWDYGHCDDYAFYYDEEPLVGKFDHSKEKKWLVEDVVKDSWWAIEEFKQLVKLAERINQRGEK